jgi:hypothetical protein
LGVQRVHALASGPEIPMRLPLASCAVALLALAAPLWAAPIEPPSVDSFIWNNGESKGFSLTWDGDQAVFTLDGVGTGVYESLADCCTDTFDRVRELHPGATLTFTDLAINTLPVNTVFVDNLNLSLLKTGALDNLGLLTGLVTLEWDDPFTRMPLMSFSVLIPDETVAFGENDEPVTAVPEPATLFLLGSGLLAVSFVARNRARRGVQP